MASRTIGASRAIGLIGLGLLGSALAERLLASGHSLLGFDIDPERRANLERLGGEAADSSTDIAQRCRRIFLSLPTSDTVDKLLSEIENGLAPESIIPESIIIDTTTGDPDQISAFGPRLAERGVEYLDATVGGSSQQVRTAEALVLVGGEAETFEACQALFSSFAKRAFHVGPCGSGARMKLVFNLVLGLNRAVLAEGLSFAEASGIDAAQALEVLQAGAAYSTVMDTKGRKMIDQDFSAQARLSQHLKDVRLILASGGRSGARLPLSQLHRSLLEEVEAAGLGEADNSAIIKAFEPERRPQIGNNDNRMRTLQPRLSRSVAALAVLLALFAAVSCGDAGDSSNSSSSSVTIGAMRPGTSWYVFAATLANLLQKDLPEGTGAEVIARGGAIGNPILVDRGEASVALAQAATAVWAANGDPKAYKKKHENIRALVGGLNSVWVTALLREEYIARTGNDTLEKALSDDQPIRVVMKPAGSVVPVFADMVLAAFGTSREKIVSGGGEVTQVSANQIAAILRDGRADLYFETAIRGHPTITEITTTVDIRFVDLPDSVLDQLKGPGVNAIPLPQYFKGQRGPTKAVDMGTVLICHKDFPDDLAYLVTKTVCENKEEMGRAHKAWLDFVPEQGGLIEKTGIPLHPGAARYFTEKGWL